MTETSRPTLMLIPGLSGSCVALGQAAPEMFPAFSLLPFEHRVGSSLHNFESLAELAASQLSAEHPAYICGESFGGPIALTIARRYPERVAGLILLSTFARLPRAGQLHARMGVAVWAQMIDRAPSLAVGARAVSMPGSIGRIVSRETMRRYLTEPFMSGTEYQHKVRLIAGFDARPWLREIACPSIVLPGKRDPTVPVRWGRELAAHLPNSTIHELECGHLGYLAVPNEIRRHVDGWLANQSAGLTASAVRLAV